MKWLKIEKLDLLISVYIFCIAVSELMGAKTFPIYNAGSIHLNASVAIFVIPFLFTVNDMVVEVYGKERARSIIRAGLLMVFLLMLTSLFFTYLPASKRFLSTEAAYDTIFLKSARISAASLIAFAVAEFTDIFIFSRIRERMGKKALWFRNNISNFIAQFFDTTLFISLAFYALNKTFGDNLSFLWSLILPYWLLKCALSLIETPFVYLGVNWLKKDLDKDSKTKAV